MNTWLDTSFEMRFRVIDGLTVRFATSEDHRDHDALLLSPWPESLLAFEPTWWRLAERAHLVAIDLPGFGHSQRCDPLLSPRAMGEFLIAAADAFGLEYPHVVGPERRHGGRAVRRGEPSRPASEPGRRQRRRRGSAPTGRGAEGLGRGPRPIGADEFRRADPRQLVTVALRGISRYSLPDFVREDYLSSYEGDRMAESLRYWRSCPAELPVLSRLLPQIDTPVQIIAGARDIAVPPSTPNSSIGCCRTAGSTSSTQVTSPGKTPQPSMRTLVTNWWCGGHATMSDRTSEGCDEPA